MSITVVAAAPTIFAMFVAGVPTSEVLLAPSADSHRRLRGDFETPDAMIIAMTEPSDTHATLLLAAASHVDTFVLSPQDREELALSWVEQVAVFDAVGVLEAELDSDWVRDFGPLQVEVDGAGLLWLDPSYYPERPHDDVVPRVLSDALGVPLETLDLPIEGGAIISNGAGLCASTLETFDLFGMAPDDEDARLAVQELMQQMGCDAWALVPALANDPTSHIDMLAQFLSHDVLLVAEVDALDAPIDAERLEEAVHGFEMAAEALGQPLRIIRVPTPVVPAQDLYFSYVNATRLGSAFLVPSYEMVSPAQEEAIFGVLAQALGDSTQLIPIPADEFIALNGAVHCLTLGVGLPPSAP